MNPCSSDSTVEITADHVKELLVEQGLEVISSDDQDTFQVRDLESGLAVTCVLQENILFSTLPLLSVAADKVNLDLTRTLLDAGNGISTSAFQLYDMPDGNVRITLNNFCKLQDLGAEDQDDILSCITFLQVDAMAARQLLADLA